MASSTPACSDTTLHRHFSRSKAGVVALRVLNESNQPEVETVTHAIETEVRRIRRLSQPRAGSPKQCSVDDTLIPLISLHRASGTAIDDSQIESGAWVQMQADDLARAIGNLLDNCAVHAPSAAVTIVGEIDAERGFLPADHHRRRAGNRLDACMSVMDRGVSTRAGGGLGLFSVRSIVETNGGIVSLDLDVPGTSVRLDLPSRCAHPHKPRLHRAESISLLG